MSGSSVTGELVMRGSMFTEPCCKHWRLRPMLLLSFWPPQFQKKGTPWIIVCSCRCTRRMKNSHCQTGKEICSLKKKKKTNFNVIIAEGKVELVGSKSGIFFLTVTGRSETSQPGLTHFLQTPLLDFKQRNAPLREEEGRGGAIVSLQCQLAEREGIFLPLYGHL